MRASRTLAHRVAISVGENAARRGGAAIPQDIPLLTIVIASVGVVLGAFRFSCDEMPLRFSLPPRDRGGPPTSPVLNLVARMLLDRKSWLRRPNSASAFGK